MPMYDIDPEVMERPILQRGIYGPGLDNEADVEWTGFEMPAEFKLPAYDRDGERGPYAYFAFKVRTADGKFHFPEEWIELTKGSGPKIREFFTNLGVEFSKNERGGLRVDTDEVLESLPKKVSGISMAAPRVGDTRSFNGRVLAVIGKAEPL